MKTTTLKLLFVLIIGTFLFSCTSDEDGIYNVDSAVIEDITISYTPMEFEILNLVNDYRVSVGLQSLHILNLISNEAISHTDYMIDSGEISHDNFSTRYSNLVNTVAAKKVGENVAYGYGSAEAVVNAWIKSDGHRKNIENELYTDFGISTKKDVSGRNYFTHIFIKR